MTNLFRSSLSHHHWIELQIKRAKVVGNCSASDLIMGNGSLITVAMTETQFAKMMTSLNVGSGSPCTLERVNGERIEDCPSEERHEFIKKTHDKHLEDRDKRLQETISEMRGAWAAKRRPTLKQFDQFLRKLEIYSANFETNQKYYKDRFKEEMDAIVSEAKTEVETHIVDIAGKLGVSSNELPKLES